jgi:hypothetical protein
MKLNWNPPKIPPQLATHAWAADYATDVHEGRKRFDGTEMPPRRWTDAALAEVNLPQRYAELFRELGDHQSAFEALNYELGDKFAEMIESPIWEWDKTTFRSNGEVVGSPRDIVDTGNLRDSYRLSFL